jgi:hypothetical protein
MLGVAATLMRDGYSPDLAPLYGEPAGPLQRIPPYVFDGSARYWFDTTVSRQHHWTSHVDVAENRADPVDSPRPPANSPEEVLALIADVGNYPVTTLARSKR